MIMLRVLCASVAAVVLWAGCALALDLPPGPQGDLDSRKAQLARDLTLFSTWFEGRFDNEQQTFWEKELGVVEGERHNRIHSVFRRADIPAFGAHVFYVEQFSGPDLSNLYRQRIYAFSVDAEENAIRLDILALKNEAALRGAWRDPSRLKALTAQDVTRLDPCAVYWRRVADQFHGVTKRGSCVIVSRRDARTLVIEDDLVLTRDEIWIRDRAVDANGAPVYGNVAGIAHKLKRVRPFSCWVSVLRGAAHGEDGAGAKPTDWTFDRNLWIHDQGGRVMVRTDEEPPRAVELRLRRVAWPTGTNRDSLTLYVHRDAEERAISYVWGEADAQRLAINLRWLQASCTHEPQRLFE